MKGIRIEIQTLLLALVIIITAVVSGFYFFSSLAGLVDVVHRQALTDPVLLEIRDLASDLPEVENTARLYILSADGSHLMDYQEMNDSVVAKLNGIDHISEVSYFSKPLLDSVRSLVLQRLILWNEILEIHLAAKDQSGLLPDLARQIISATPDTIEVEVPRKGVIANLFRKKKTETETRIVPPANLDELEDELNKLQRSLTESSQRIRSREAELLEANQQLASNLYSLIWHLESLERARMESNTSDAAGLAASARNRVMLLGSVVVVVLIILIFLVLRFIRKNRETQKVLIKSRRQAEELARAKEMFIAHVSHEMRTPVNAIFGITGQVLQRELDVHVKKDLGIIYNSAKHLSSLVNDTLDLARIHSNLLSIHASDFSPASVLNEAIELMRPEADAKNLNLVWQSAGELPEALSGDPLRLKQMVINLLGNAIKFTEAGFVRLAALALPVNEEFSLRITVSDSGKGIGAEELPRVFDEFMQSADNDPVRHRGTGLGLAIVKKLAQLQGGKVSIKSTPGKGTEVGFTISYPIGDPGNLQQPELHVSVSHENLRGLHVLLVDDEPYNRHLLRLILQKWHIGLVEATNGKEAVDMAMDQDFDVILMDIRMPVKDGVTASKEILGQKPDSLIIALTATSGKDEVERFYRAGIKAYLPKPFRETQLLKLLSEAILPGQAEGSAPITRMENLSTSEIEIQDPPVDIGELYRIADGNQSFVRELIRIFIHSTEKNLTEMHKALADKNFDRISNLAHKMAPPVMHIRADALYQEIKDLENLEFADVPEQVIEGMIKSVESRIATINEYMKDML